MKDLTLTRQAVETGSADASRSGNEVYKVGVVTTAILAGAVGLWSVVCLASAIFTEGGPLAMVKNLMSAVTGM